MSLSLVRLISIRLSSHQNNLYDCSLKKIYITVPSALGQDFAFNSTSHNNSKDKKPRRIWNTLLIELDSPIFGKWATEKKILKCPENLTDEGSLDKVRIKSANKALL